MSSEREDPVTYYAGCADAHREYARRHGRTSGQIEYHLAEARRYDGLAADAAAAHAFPAARRGKREE